ncbi:MAG: hypothetical protein ABII74_02005 [Elusimicrobiota bacterium]
MSDFNQINKLIEDIHKLNTSIENKARKIKETGKLLLDKSIEHLREMQNYDIRFLDLIKSSKLKKYRAKHLEIFEYFIRYNESIDDFLSIGNALQYTQINTTPIFEFQRNQIQDILSESSAILSSKKVEINFYRSLSISLIALGISVLEPIMNLIKILYSTITMHLGSLQSK